MDDNATASLYHRLGGEAGIHRLVDTFYEIMDSRPEAAGIRALHPDDLSGSRQKLFMYFSGWFGGPPLFTDAYGHPRLRARHLPFAIGISERDQWLFCLAGAFKELQLEQQLAEDLWEKIAPMADHMRNQEDSIPGCPAHSDRSAES
ncbi:MAG TPA: globin [Gammaproteobacteria bacterium]|nr:globin [Gammaproteobacteria bacterium]